MSHDAAVVDFFWCNLEEGISALLGKTTLHEANTLIVAGLAFSPLRPIPAEHQVHRFASGIFSDRIVGSLVNEVARYY